MSKEQGWILVVGILVILGSSLYWYIANQHTIPVLSRPYGTWNEYYLYVPGDKSTCAWTYEEKGSQQSFSTQPDPQTGEHTLFYDASVSNTKVTCLNDQGVKYVGRFSN